MTQRDKIFSLINEHRDVCFKHCSGHKNCINCEYKDKEHCIQEFLTDYLINNGVVSMPCKFGDNLFYIGNGKVERFIAQGYIGVTDDGTFFSERCYWPLDAFGTVVFPTYEEAAAKLNEGE